MSLAALQGALRDVRRIALDTSVLMAAADDGDARRASAQWLLDEIAGGRFGQSVISTLTAAEVLVRPAGRSVEEATLAQQALLNFDHLAIAAVDLDVAVEAAYVRAVTGLKLPDAIVLATAVAHKVEAIVHADRDWIRKARPYERFFKIVYLG